MGDTSDEYNRVWEYNEAIRKSNPGSAVVVKVVGIEIPLPFFKECCRPILGVDGAHLKGPFPGILLTAIGKDGNKNIFPMSWAIVEVENAKTWTWFLELLVEDIASVAHTVTWVREIEDDVTFMLDRQKGMLDAFSKVILNAETSFNNVLREARAKPSLSLMEWIRQYVMIRCSAKREGLQNFDGVIMPSVVKMIERGMKIVGSMRLTQADLHEFEVDHEGDKFVVNLETKTCGCYRRTLMGIPCWHALACIAKRRLNYEDFVHLAYHVATYATTYTPSFHAIPG
ncbi:uncharacterized protein LOC110686613 [Chenopodium quinoa]|uniref:uncharacterized protein LOC110686613 n=1 Tax=Chenopodium quinoa TaxID=63459 RepID=UPI000B77FACE|nr:uncharacterized protein LOC110686613 [Chenopodium quinoa]